MKPVIAGLALMVTVATEGVAIAAPAPAECHARANDTAARLTECIQTDPLWRHLKKFQDIADANPDKQGHGNRDTGTSGYRASVDYVARLMHKAGYQVTVQSYPWKHFDIIGTPSFRANGSDVAAGDWSAVRLSGNGHVNAAAQALKGIGCARADFHNFKSGRIALVERGTCDFDTQITNAEAAGAAAIILYNNRADATSASAGKAHSDGKAFQAQLASEVSVPVIGALSHALGAELAALSEAGKPPMVLIDVHTQRRLDIDYNVIADSPYGDPDRVVVIDGHLDSIYGAGILDNASGSATMLEIALNLAQTPTRNRLRYIWFGGEEIGLLGSKYYTRNLSADELRKIAFDLDADVTATPNYDVLVADPGHARNVDKFPPNVVPDSKVGNRAFLSYFKSAGIAAQLAWFGNDGTDSNTFSIVGVPNTGILTQQDCCKHTWEVGVWGGYPGNYEGKVPGHNGGCVDRRHRWCDNLSNNDPLVLEFVSKAVAAVTLNLANHRFAPPH